ncbi:MAG: response regulator [Bacteroidota bacterium]
MGSEPIIIIDDDKEDLELLKEMITEMRFPNPVVTFNDSLAALGFLRKSLIEPLVILCDINMPKLNGLQFRSELLTLDSPVNEVPFLFLTTSKPENEKSLAKELKVFAFYTKAPTFSGMKEILQSIMVSLKIDPRS